MQRSGNHAIINWVAGHFNGHTIRNNLLGLSYDSHCDNVDILPGYKVRPKTRIPTLIHVDAWENYNPSSIRIAPHSEPLMVILRDPYNWFASWIQCKHKVDSSESGLAWYLTYLQYVINQGNPFICFNRWFVSEEYRRGLEHFLDLCESDDNLQRVAANGGGSSFDDTQYDGRAQDMAVLSRFEQVMHLPAYKEPLRKYPDLADISRELFDFEPPQGIHS
jgi:hypothetical protein